MAPRATHNKKQKLFKEKNLIISKNYDNLELIFFQVFYTHYWVVWLVYILQV